MIKEFRLPTYLELSKEQDRILRKLQSTDRAIIAGAPGTGKSVIVLLLARKLKDQADACLCLLYTQVLKQMAMCLVKGLEVNTWHSWFRNFYYRSYRQRPPETSRFTYDWNAIMEALDGHDLARETETAVLIDEGQDMPPEFYEFMDEHFQLIIVSADEHQQLWEHNSCLKDIKARLEVPQEHCFELHQNYRNSHQIARLAQSFYCDTVVGPPELPERNGEIPVLVDYPDRQVIIQRIARRHRVNPHRLIAVLAPDNALREDYYTGLKQAGVPALYTYAGSLGKNNRPIQFDSGGIVVLNARSAKGLEFDEVFIADLDRFYYSSDREAFRKEMYVLISRAKEQLFILINTCNNPHRCRRILAEFPTDAAVLKRWPETRMETVDE